MKRTDDPILYNIRRARAKSEKVARSPKPIPPEPTPAPDIAPPPESPVPPPPPEFVESPPEPISSDIKTLPDVDNQPDPAPTIETATGLDWLLRRNRQ